MVKMKKTKYIRRSISFNSEEAALKMAKKYREHYKRTKKFYHVMVSNGKRGVWYIYIYNKRRRLFKETLTLTDRQLKEIIHHANNSRERIFLSLISYSGRRISEVIGKWGLRPIDVNLKDNTMKFIILKQHGLKDQEERRSIVMPDFVINEVLKYASSKQLPPDKPIIKYGRKWGYRVVKEAGDKMGLKLHPHLFRHSYAARLAKEAKTPGDIVKIQDQLQHADSRMTLEYIRTYNKEATRELVENTFKVVN